MMANTFDRLEALAFRLFLSAIGGIGIERASGLGERVMRLVGPCMPRHQKVLFNLTIAFPERDAVWRKATAAAMWGQFGKGIAEYAYLPELCRDAASRIEFVNHADTETLRREGRPIMFVAAHQANWNLPAIVGQLLGVEGSVLFRRRKNPYLETVIEHWRNQLPCGFIDVDERAAKAMLDELRGGRCIGLYIDRRSAGGEFLPFFGVKTPTPIVAARLALKTGAAFIPIRIERLANVRFRITVYPQIEPAADAADDRMAACGMTEAANRLFESWISERPEQWLSTARRWPRETPLPDTLATETLVNVVGATTPKRAETVRS